MEPEIIALALSVALAIVSREAYVEIKYRAAKKLIKTFSDAIEDENVSKEEVVDIGAAVLGVVFAFKK